jgi:hypothetical protein
MGLSPGNRLIKALVLTRFKTPNKEQKMSPIFKKIAALCLLGLLLPWLAACGGNESAPTLGQLGRPTLAFIYTDD